MEDDDVDGKFSLLPLSLERVGKVGEAIGSSSRIVTFIMKGRWKGS